MQFKSYMHGLCDYFLKLEYMKRLCLLGFSHSVCSKEVHDMFYVFLCIQLNKKQNPDVWPLI